VPTKSLASGISGTRRRQLLTEARSSAQASPEDAPYDENFFLRQVEETVDRVLSWYYENSKEALDNGNGGGLEIDFSNKTAVKGTALAVQRLQPPSSREAVGVAMRLKERLLAFRKDEARNCPRCWLQRAHCVCRHCPVLSASGTIKEGTTTTDTASSPLFATAPRVDKMFLVMHHKEICLTVDTAKLLMASMPRQVHLVVSGIGPEFQPTAKDLHDAVQGLGAAKAAATDAVWALFPSPTARTASELLSGPLGNENDEGDDGSHYNRWDRSISLIVFDGTWEQARRMYKRYIPVEREETDDTTSSVQRVRLSDKSLATIVGDGRQLRRHPLLWREISTVSAVRLLFQDLHECSDGGDGGNRSRSQQQPPPSPDGSTELLPWWDALAEYQAIADAAARKQLGRPRTKSVP